MSGMPRNRLSDIICVHCIAIFLLYLEAEERGKEVSVYCAAPMPRHCVLGSDTPFQSRLGRCVNV